MRHLDLFTGIGGFTIAAESIGFETVAFSEINEDKCIVLKHYWPHIPNLGDICDEQFLNRAREIGPIDLLTGGVPCQPASALGQMRGITDERWRWPEFVGVVRALRPGVAVAENPPSVLVLPEFERVLGEIATLGYDLLWDVIPAAAVGAGHLRERVFLIATDARRSGWQTRTGLRTVQSNGEKRRRSGDANGETSSDAYFQRRSETGRSVLVREEDRNRQVESLRQFAEINREASFADTDNARLQGYAGDAPGNRNSGSNRSIAPPDLRGRVNCRDWWHEAHTGIPVLAPGISGRLAEAISCCIGDSVVPQVAAAVLQPIYEMLSK